MIYLVAFYLFYITNLELVGIGLGIAINFISYLFLLVDIGSSPKKSDPVVFIFLIGIIGMFIANVLLLITLVRLHSAYSSQKSPIQYTKENRKKLDKYKQLFIVNVLAIFIMAFFYFTAYKINLAEVDNMSYLLKNNFEKSGDYYVPFYNFTLDPSGNKIVESFMLSLKGVLSILVCVSTGLMINYSYELQKLRASQIYIPAKQYDNAPQEIPHKSSYSAFSLPNMFQNLNMNYLLYSTTII
jgi:glycerol uptake facilitator-like aquaporin